MLCVGMNNGDGELRVYQEVNPGGKGQSDHRGMKAVERRGNRKKSNNPQKKVEVVTSCQ